MRLHENDGVELQQIPLALINLLAGYCLLGKTGEKRADKNHEMIKKNKNKINTHKCPLQQTSLQRTRVMCSGFGGALRAALIDVYFLFFSRSVCGCAGWLDVTWKLEAASDKAAGSYRSLLLAVTDFTSMFFFSWRKTSKYSFMAARRLGGGTGWRQGAGLGLNGPTPTR